MNDTKSPPVQCIGIGIFAMAWAIGITGLFAKFAPRAFAVLPVVFVVSWSGLYFVDWLLIKRPERVNKNVPITSKEWRRRQKEFYDSTRINRQLS